jgi:hypothetical protein
MDLTEQRRLAGITPARPLQEEVDAEFAKAHAVTAPEQLVHVFDKLKSNQTIWVAYSAVMSTASKAYRPYVVGRRSHSKKYNVSSITITPPGTKPGRMMKVTLRKRGDRVSLALGDMGASLIGIYVP